MKSHKVVRIHWRDAYSIDGWTPSDEVSLEPVIIETIGMIVTEDVNLICIASTWDQTNDTYACMMTIPKKWIIQRRLIK